MLRKDRQITERADFIDILDRCKVCRLALQTDGAPYVLPMNYAYEMDEAGALTLYVHCRMKGGYKLELLAQNPVVGFELDCDHGLIEADIPCLYGFSFSSIIGSGRMEEVTDLPEKMRILALLMRHQTGRDFTIREVEGKTVGIWRLKVDTYTGKHRLMPKPE